MAGRDGASTTCSENEIAGACGGSGLEVYDIAAGRRRAPAAVPRASSDNAQVVVLSQVGKGRTGRVAGPSGARGPTAMESACPSAL